MITAIGLAAALYMCDNIGEVRTTPQQLQTLGETYNHTQNYNTVGQHEDGTVYDVQVIEYGDAVVVFAKGNPETASVVINGQADYCEAQE